MPRRVAGAVADAAQPRDSRAAGCRRNSATGGVAQVRLVPRVGSSSNLCQVCFARRDQRYEGVCRPDEAPTSVFLLSRDKAKVSHHTLSREHHLPIIYHLYLLFTFSIIARCDLIRPQCSNCVKRGLQCQYVLPPQKSNQMKWKARLMLEAVSNSVKPDPGHSPDVGILNINSLLD
ncbi:hypothetical protein BDR26DRAFT_850937 [Obelidium mucronatum]|nr:hypothetical protein BDR26DRAFT_850937 [Obelidium mucronatum]